MHKPTPLKKSVSLIHISATDISLMARKLYNCLLWHVVKCDFNDQVYSIPFSRVLILCGVNPKNWNKAKQSLESLQDIKVKWDLCEDGGGVSFGSIPLLGGVTVTNGVLRFDISPQLKPYVFKPEVFALLKLHITSLFKSKYSLHLYENITRYKDVGSTGWMPIDKWKILLGADKPLYKSTAMFNSRIVNPAVDEVNTVSDLTIEPEYTRQGKERYISHLRFHITSRAGFNSSPPDEQLSLMELSKEILEAYAGISPTEFATSLKSGSTRQPVSKEPLPG